MSDTIFSYDIQIYGELVGGLVLHGSQVSLEYLLLPDCSLLHSLGIL